MQKQQDLVPPYLQILNLTTPISQLNTKKDSQRQQKQMQCRQYKNGMYYGRYNNKSNMEGIGIIIYDDANIIIAQFKNGNIHGHFCCFIYDDQMWVYGKYVGGKMEGFGGIYLKGGNGIGLVFMDGVVIGQWIFKNGAFVGQYTSLNQSKQIKNNLDIKFPKSPPSPTSYIESHLSPSFQTPNNPSSSSSSQLIISESTQTTTEYENKLKIFEISDHQLYYGTSQDNKPNGIGVIFISQWPVCYGQFCMGQLEGLGRVQQNQLMVVDGVFQDSKIRIGWVVDRGQGFTAFGHAGHHENNKNIFKIKQEHKGIQKQQIQKFRRRIHLQSLQFTNSHISPFPQHIKQALPPQHYNSKLNNLTFQPSPKAHKSRAHKSRTAENMLINIKQDNFIPSFISEISRLNPHSPRSYTYHHDKEKDDASMRVQKELIDLIKEYNQSRSVYERNSKIVSSKVKEHERKDGIRLMEQVVRSRSKSNPKPLPVSQQKPQKSGKIQNISRMPSSRDQIKKLTQSRVQQSSRKTQRRLNLQEVYNKYLRKQF